MKTLLIEDDALLARGLSKALSDAGFTVNWAANASAARASFKQDPTKIIVLDLGLPDLDGLALLKVLKTSDNDFSTIILTARDGIDDKVRGLELGADDYLTKPFSTKELVARLNVIKRRINAASPDEIVLNSIVINAQEHWVTYQGQVVELSASEFVVLRVLLEQPNRIHTRKLLEEKLYDSTDHPSSNTLEVHIHNLRKKITKDFVKTIRGVGYKVNVL